ncbi:MAG: HAMP domain-containing sensor histidine kinase [Glaciecola sp.]
MWPIKLCFYQRLSVSLVAVFFAVITLFVVASSYLQESMTHEGEQRLHLNLAAHLVHDNPLLKQGVYDYKALKNLFHTLMVLGPSFEFYFVDPQGVILTYSAEHGEVVTQQIDLHPVQQLLANPTRLPLYGTDPKSLSTQKIFSASPVYNQNDLQGYLYVIIGGAQYDSVVSSLEKNKSIQQFIMVIVAGTLFLLLALLLLFRVFTLPLKRLSDDMDSFRKSGFNLVESGVTLLPWKNDSRNEVERLGYSFNEMLQHIDSQLEQLKSTDAQRRSLLADLSHDLRTPLANLQGYVETLAIKGNALAPNERQQFIDISLKNLLNLKRLIDQIFELAYLESGHIKLKNENFLVTELLHDIAAKFTIKAKQQGVSLVVNTTQNLAYISADIEKVERVLTNLIENAIRHTPGGGKVTIDCFAGGEQVKVSVIDNGIGIAHEELQYIFDARYQASNTERDANAHVGLGLAISQKLVGLLDSSLKVESCLGNGTTFSFELPQVNP